VSFRLAVYRSYAADPKPPAGSTVFTPGSGLAWAVVNKVLHTGGAALGCLLAAAILVVAVPIPHAAEPVTVSYRSDLASLVRLAPYPAVAPAGLPGSWQPVSSGLAVGGANGAGTVTWQLGYMTPSGSLASLEETNASAPGFIRRMTNDGTALAPLRLDSQTWHLSSAPSRGQRSMYYTSSAGRTVVVTGNATWAQLSELAASLHPVTT
jgi:Protein of unknown function (DUF4245)